MYIYMYINMMLERGPRTAVVGRRQSHKQMLGVYVGVSLYICVLQSHCRATLYNCKGNLLLDLHATFRIALDFLEVQMCNASLKGTLLYSWQPTAGNR